MRLMKDVLPLQTTFIVNWSKYMKKRALKFICLIETIFIILVILYECFAFMNSKETEILRETSPNGDYVLCISEIGTPDWPFGKDHLFIMFYENDNLENYRISFSADVANNGCKASYEIEWLEEGVLIALKGSEQPTAYYILPFKTLNE